MNQLPEQQSGSTWRAKINEIINWINNLSITPSSIEGLTANASDLNKTSGVTGDIVGTEGAQTLEEKTIDANANTISNLDMDNLKDSAKTPVSSDPEVQDINDESLSSQIPSSKQVYDYGQSLVAGAKAVTLNPFNTTGSTNHLRYNISTNRLDSGDYNKYEWQVPNDFNEIISVKVIHVPDTVETTSWDQYFNKETTIIASDTLLKKVVEKSNTYDEIDVTTFFQAQTINAGDFIGYRIASNFSYGYVGALVIEYK